jgi:hypothetical protein
MIKDIDVLFLELNSKSSSLLFKKRTTMSLLLIAEYLEFKGEKKSLYFSKPEFDFYNSVSVLSLYGMSDFKRKYPFFVTNSEKINWKLINKINDLFEDKVLRIKEVFKVDIKIVEEFFKFSSYKRDVLKEEFYSPQDTKYASWNENNFMDHFLNFIKCQLLLNPKGLSDSFLQKILHYFLIFGLNIEDEEKVKIANEFCKSMYPSVILDYNIRIPEKYKAITTEIRLLPHVHINNIKIFDSIILKAKDEINNEYDNVLEENFLHYINQNNETRFDKWINIILLFILDNFVWFVLAFFIYVYLKKNFF